MSKLKSSHGKDLLYKKHEHVRIFGYSDSGYVDDKGGKKFTTDYYTFVRENLVTWRRKKQDVSKISAEAEYRVMTHTACEMMWLKKTCCLSLILDSLNLCLFCDNSLLPISQNPVFRESTKHIEVDCHLIRDVWTKKVISLLFTPSSK